MATLIPVNGPEKSISVRDAYARFGRAASVLPLKNDSRYVVHDLNWPRLPRNERASDLLSAPLNGDVVVVDYDELMDHTQQDGAERLLALTLAGNDAAREAKQTQRLYCLEPGIDAVLQDMYECGATGRRVDPAVPEPTYVAMTPTHLSLTFTDGAVNLQVHGLFASPRGIWLLGSHERSELAVIPAWIAGSGWAKWTRMRNNSEARWLVLAAYLWSTEVPATITATTFSSDDLSIELDVIMPKQRLTDQQAKRIVQKLKQAVGIEDEKQTAQGRRNATIEGYLNTMHQLIRMARGKHASEAHRYCAAQFRQARLYEFDPELLDRMLVKIYADLLQHKAQADSSPDAGEFVCNQAMQMSDLPEQRPSQAMYIAFGEGFRLPANSAAALGQYVSQIGLDGEADGRKPDVGAALDLYAYLVTPKAIWALTTDSKQTFITSVWRRFDAETYKDAPELADATDGWIRTAAFLMAPWTLHWLIEILNGDAARITEQQSLTLRTRYRSKATKLKLGRKTPPPFYSVTVSHDIPLSHGDTSSETIERTYKWKVDGHERVYVQRGMLPLDPDLKAKLQRRDYTIFEGPVDERGAAAMARRNRPPQQPGEWIAMHYAWVKEHVSPARDDLPLVPSVKRVRSTRIRDP